MQYTRPAQAFASAITEVASTTSTVTLAANDQARLGCTIFNDSSAVLSLKLGLDAAANSLTVEIAAGGYYEVPFGYVGDITGFWASANGNAYVTVLR